MSKKSTELLATFHPNDQGGGNFNFVRDTRMDPNRVYYLYEVPMVRKILPLEVEDIEEKSLPPK